jgi:hypothetical protein
MNQTNSRQSDEFPAAVERPQPDPWVIRSLARIERAEAAAKREIAEAEAGS